MRIACLAALFVAAFMLAGNVRAQGNAAPAVSAGANAREAAEIFDRIGVDAKLGTIIDRELEFTNSNGELVKLGQYINGEKPLILTLNYYRCASICNTHLRNLVQEGLSRLPMEDGSEFRVLTVSIDPGETFEKAAQAKQTFTGEVELSGLDWEFFVGKPDSIAALADSVGFRYSYDPNTDQYAHPGITFFLSPEGKLVRALGGLEFRPSDMKMALIEASNGTIGTPLERVILSCFQYDPNSGKYTVVVLKVVRAGGILTTILLILTLTFLRLRERREN